MSGDRHLARSVELTLERVRPESSLRLYRRRLVGAEDRTGRNSFLPKRPRRNVVVFVPTGAYDCISEPVKHTHGVSQLGKTLRMRTSPEPARSSVYVQTICRYRIDPKFACAASRLTTRQIRVFRH